MRRRPRGSLTRLRGGGAGQAVEARCWAMGKEGGGVIEAPCGEMEERLVRGVKGGGNNDDQGI